MPDKPNLILIHTDQQRFDTIRALGFDYMDTPNLDRLVQEGIAFTRKTRSSGLRVTPSSQRLSNPACRLPGHPPNRIRC